MTGYPFLVSGLARQSVVPGLAQEIHPAVRGGLVSGLVEMDLLSGYREWFVPGHWVARLVVGVQVPPGAVQPDQRVANTGVC